jgi:1-acyl-sn-glycerol-3-phosphate acyltransferase
MDIKRPFQVAWHVVFKSSAYFFFGLGSIVLATVVFPTLRLLVHPGWRFRRAMRACIRGAFSLFVNYMRLVGLVRVRVIGKERLKTARGLVVVANHPTLLDVTVLMSMVRQPNCIVRGDLWKNPITRGVVSGLFIPQFLDFERTMEIARQSLAEGDNLIIFPEGTRSVRGKINPLKRGAAHLALRTGHDILPLRLNVPDSTGLAKHDSYFWVPRGGRFRWTIEVLEPIRVADFSANEPGRAARTLTNAIAEHILSNPKTR